MKPALKLTGNLIKDVQRVKSPEIKRGLLSSDAEIAERINSLKDDLDKIMEFEDIRGRQNTFIVVNKKISQAHVYKNGELTNKYEIGVGEVVGDDLNSSAYINGEFQKEGRTTPSGQFFVKPSKFNLSSIEDYYSGKGIGFLLLKGVQHPKLNTNVAFHPIPLPKYAERMAMFEENGSRRSMSAGCVNFIPEDFYEMANCIPKEGTRVYILPEESENKLELISSPIGLWFKTKFGNEEKENFFVDAMNKFFKTGTPRRRVE